MNKELLLINPWFEAKGVNQATAEVPLGLLYIASFLNQNNLRCSFIDANALRLNEVEVLSQVRIRRPCAIGISVNAFTYRAGLGYARAIKGEFHEIPVILGGPYATADPQRCLQEAAVDAVVCGEGELAANQILRNLEENKHPFRFIPGIAFKEGREIIVNPPSVRIENLDALTFPAYQLLPPLIYYCSRSRRWPFMGVITSRGCPYQCSFCSKDIFGNRITYRSPENVVDEIEYLVREYGIRQIDILDDNFTLQRERCERICELIISKKLSICINLQSGIRSENIDQKLLSLFRRAGVFKLAFGVESGDEEVLRRNGKYLQLDNIVRVSHMARQMGIVVIGFFIIGLPYETRKTLSKTIDFAKKMNPHFANFMIAIPFFGTPLYQTIVREGRFLIDTREGISSGFYGGEVFFEIAEVTRDTVLYYYRKAYRDFYGRPGKLIDMVKTLRSRHEWKWFLSSVVDVLR